MCRILLRRTTLFPSCCAHRPGRTHVVRSFHPVFLFRVSVLLMRCVARAVFLVGEPAGLLVFGRMRSAVTGSELHDITGKASVGAERRQDGIGSVSPQRWSMPGSFVPFLDAALVPRGECWRHEEPAGLLHVSEQCQRSATAAMQSYHQTSAELLGLSCSRSGQLHGGDRPAPRLCSTARRRTRSEHRFPWTRCTRRRVHFSSGRYHSDDCSAWPRYRCQILCSQS